MRALLKPVLSEGCVVVRSAALFMVSVIALGGDRAFGQALGTNFTYQGQLKQAGMPLNSAADFEFRLFDALSGGTQIGGVVVIDNLNVVNGLFSVSLDFGGPPAFGSDARWLEVDVRTPPGSGSFTTLSPRQAISAVPFALQTRGIVVDAAGRVGIGTSTPQIALHLIAPNTGPTPGEGIRIQGTQSSGANLSYLSFANGAGTAIGYVGDGGSGENNIYLGAYGADIGLVNSTFGTALIAKASGRIGIGTSAPSSNLSVIGTADFTGNVGIGTSTSGSRLDVNADNGIAVHAKSASASSLLHWAVYADNQSTNGSSTGGGVIGIGRHYGVYGESFGTDAIGVLGKGNSTAGFDFYATGSGVNYGSPSSIRWKRNITSIDDPLAKIEAMRGVMFDWDTEHGGNHDVGFIGEEVGRVLPEVVAWEADDCQFVTGMDYSKLTPLLVEAVKALRAESDAKFDELRAQKDAEIAELRARLEALEAKMQAVLAGPGSGPIADGNRSR